MKLFCPARVILFIFLLLVLTPLPHPVSAQEPEAANQLAEDQLIESITPPNPTPTISEFSKQYDGKVISLISFLHITSCIVIGERCSINKASIDNQNLPPLLQNLRPYYKDGLMGVAGNLLTASYSNPPASLSYGLYQIKTNLLPSGTVYAQAGGIGFNVMAAFAAFWSINRNIAYSLIVLALLITGFLLMFRYKIDANNSINLEKILARTIVVILTITFSYTIAGFLIDIMYISILMIINIAKVNHLVSVAAADSLLQSNPQVVFSNFLSQNAGSVVQAFMSLIPPDLLATAKGLLTNIFAWQFYPSWQNAIHDVATMLEYSAGIGISTEFDPGALVASIISFPISMAAGEAVATWVISFVLNLAIEIAVLFLYYKILFMLIGSYVEIIFSVIFAPYLLLADMIPGKNHFVLWIKRLIANIATFPLLALFFITGAVITQAINKSTNTFLPPPLSGMNQSILASLVGVGILMAIPAMIDKAKRAIVPEYALVNFPSGPGALLGTIATILPFIPVLGSIGSLPHGFSPGFIKPKGAAPGGGQQPSQPATPEIPHVPHQPGGGGGVG